MPSFYPSAMPGHLPLTPPEFVPGYDAHPCRPSQYQDPYMTQQGMAPRLDSVVDYSHQYVPPASSALSATHYRNSGYHNSQSLPPISSYYEPMGAPILPPLRIQENYSSHDEYRLRMQQQTRHDDNAQQQPQKEEKVSGGVSAKLDYEMERMTDFVAQTAQGIIQPGLPIQPSFRKWVLQVLSATRLPSATILLSLHYLTIRMRDFPNTIGSSENSIYRLLAVSMILGSKFLDDNTFINRSWSDVTGIKVSELNTMEREWLEMISFRLHADPTDPNGVSMWLRAWKDWDDIATNKARVMKLQPLDTNVAGIHRQSTMRNESPYQPGYTRTAYGTYTPLSSSSATFGGSNSFVSADPWNRPPPATSDYYGSQNRYSMYDDQMSRHGGHSRQSLPPLQAVTPNYYSPWNQTPRSGAHGYGCNCMMCVGTYNSYNMRGHTGYAPQSVMG